MIAFITRLMKDKYGATAVEYGILVGLLTVALIGGVSSTGGNMSAIFNNVSFTLANAGN